MRFTAVENIINNVSSVRCNYDNNKETSEPRTFTSNTVHLDTARIVNNEEYILKPKSYKNFINEHWDDILHIEPVQYYKNFVTLVEDTNDPKWLFDIEDLIEIDDNQEPETLDCVIKMRNLVRGVMKERGLTELDVRKMVKENKD